MVSLPTGSITVNGSPFAKAAASAPISVLPPTTDQVDLASFLANQCIQMKTYVCGALFATPNIHEFHQTQMSVLHVCTAFIGDL
jgi:hypothetical protein